MSSEKNDIPPPPVTQIQPTDSTDGPIIMRDHQHKVGDWTSLGRRHSSRKRDSRDFFVPTPFRSSPQLQGHGLRRGPGRPPKHRSDECSASQPLRRGPGRPRRKRSDESSASQPLRHCLSRPQRNKSDAPTNAPEVVLPPPMPPTGSEGNIPEQVSLSTNAPEVTFPPPMPPTGSNGKIPERLSMSPPPPVPPSGSVSDTPLLVPCDEEDDQTEAKLKLALLSKLETPKQTQSQMPEKSKKVLTDEVQSVLVSHLSSGTTTSVDDMVNFANSAFSTLNWIGADYGPFYEDVKNMISYKYDLFNAERKKGMLSVSKWEKKYQEIVTCADDMEKKIKDAQAKQEKNEEKKEHLKIQIEDAKKLIHRLEREVADIEQDEKFLKEDEKKYEAAHKITHAKVEILGTKMEEAREMQREIERRKNEALQGIESTTQWLLAYVKEREK